MGKMRVAEYLAAFLASRGRHVFMVTGGGAMFLNDALAHADGLAPVYCHHEQACAMAAEAYARVTNTPGVLNVTTGPGGINALNGVFGAFTDSIPLVILSGQVKRDTHLVTTPVPGLRQLGDQEADIVSMARPVCKDALTLTDPLQARAVIERAWALCQHGRPGPVWIDIPIDVQSAQIDVDSLAPWDQHRRRCLEYSRAMRSMRPSARCSRASRHRSGRCFCSVRAPDCRGSTTTSCVSRNAWAYRSRPAGPTIPYRPIIRSPAARAPSAHGREISCCKPPISSSCSAAG